MNPEFTLTRPIRVLVVEDEPKLRQLVSNQLHALGYEVRAVENGEQALHLLSIDDNFALLFTDIVLPEGVTGLDLARRARRAFGSGLKVLLTSGYPEHALKEDITRDPDMSLLRKPYRRGDLEEAILEALHAKLGPRSQ